MCSLNLGTCNGLEVGVRQPNFEPCPGVAPWKMSIEKEGRPWISSVSLTLEALPPSELGAS
jgi:hypothetical protein